MPWILYFKKNLHRTQQQTSGELASTKRHFLSTCIAHSNFILDNNSRYTNCILHCILCRLLSPQSCKSQRGQPCTARQPYPVNKMSTTCFLLGRIDYVDRFKNVTLFLYIITKTNLTDLLHTFQAFLVRRLGDFKAAWVRLHLLLAKLLGRTRVALDSLYSPEFYAILVQVAQRYLLIRWPS